MNFSFTQVFKRIVLFVILIVINGAVSYSQVLTEYFSGSNLPAGWSLVNNGAGNNWSVINSSSYNYNGTGSSGSSSLRYSKNNAAADAWAFTKAVNLTAGKAYRMEFYQRVRSASNPENLKVTVGNANNVVSQTVILTNLPDLTNTNYTKRTTQQFTPSVTGNYFFAFNCYSEANQRELYIDYIKIEEVPAVITVSDNSLPVFFSMPNVPSVQQSYTIAGSYISENITVSAPSGFEISATGGTAFNGQAQLVIPAVNNEVAETTIYIRSNSSASNAFSGFITHSSGSAVENINVTGNNAACSPVNKVVNILSGITNWLGLSWIGGAPQACDNAVINVNLTGLFNSESAVLDLQGSLSVNDLTINLKSGGLAAHNVLIRTNGHNLNVRGNLKLQTSDGTVAPSSIIFEGNGNSVVSVGGDIILSGNSGTIWGMNYSNTVAISGLNLRVQGDIITNELAGFTNTSLLLDGTSQSVINNNDQPLSFKQFNVGFENSPVITLGSNTDLIVDNNLLINNGSELIIPEGASISQENATGTFALNGNSVLRIRDNNGNTNLPGSNFPSGFAGYSASPLSTVFYEGTNQHIFGGISYGNLNMGSGIKTAPAGELNITGNFINEGAEFLHNLGVVKINGNNAQVFAGLPYNSLVLGGGNTKYTADNLSIRDSLKLLTATTLSLNANDTITLSSSSEITASFARMESGAQVMYGANSAFTVERYIPATGKAWQHLSAPAKGQSIKAAWQEGAAAPNANPKPGYGTQLTSNLPNAVAGLGYDVLTPSGASIKVYNSNTGNWESAPGTHTEIANKEGYMVFVRGDRSVTAYNQPSTSTILRTSGKLYTTGADAPANSVVPAGKFAAVANPYASAIDFSKLDRTGIQNVFYVWDPRLTGGYGYGAFQTFIPTANGYMTVIPGGSYANGNTTIESGQAFIVKGTSGGSVSFSENAKSVGSNLVTRPGGANDQLRIVLNVISNNQPVTLDAAMITYDALNSNGIDDNDILKFPNSTENISILKNGVVLTAERRNAIIPGDTIFLNLKNLAQRTYSLDINSQDLGDPSLVAVLQDAYLQTELPIDLDANTNIVFTVNGEVGSKAFDRFRIVFKPGNVLPVNITRITAIRNNEKSVTIEWSAENEFNMEVYSVERSTDGLVFTEIGVKNPSVNNNGGASYNFIDGNAGSSEYFYRVRAKSIGGQQQLTAIVKVAAVLSENVFNIFPNPVENKMIQLHHSQANAGRYQVALANQAGQIIYRSNVAVTGNGVSVIRVPASTTSGVYFLSLIGENGERRSMKVQIL